MEDEIVRVEICCKTGHITITPLTPEEISEKKASDEVTNQKQLEVEAVRAQLLATVQASDDPSVQALAKLLMS